jgi:hypothetical protein
LKTPYVSLALLVILCLSGWAAYTRAQGTPSRKWEYRVDPVPGIERSVTSATEFDKPVIERNRAADERLINQRAAEDWELAAVGGTFYYLKRPK